MLQNSSVAREETITQPDLKLLHIIVFNPKTVFASTFISLLSGNPEHNAPDVKESTSL